MAKTTRRKPKEEIPKLPPDIKHNIINGGRTHRITLTRRFTGDKEITKNFAKFEDAANFVKQQLEAKSATSLGLTADQLASARLAFSKLDGIAMEKAIEFYYSHGPGRRVPMRLSEARDRYLEALANIPRKPRKPKYIHAQGISINLMIKEMGDLFLSEYTAEKINDWLTKIKKRRKWGEINHENYYRDYKMAFNFFTRHGLIGINPLQDVIFDPLRKGQEESRNERKIQIYTVDECQALLNTADLNPCLDLLGWFAVGLFSGIRVDEMKKLNWGDFSWKDKRIVINSEVAAKGGIPRSIPISPILQSWIDRTERKLGRFFDDTNYRHRIDTLHRLARVRKKRNGLRHSFASYHYSHHEDADLTRKLLGHNCSEVLFRNYATMLSKDDAAAYWKNLVAETLTPEEEETRKSGREKRKLEERLWEDYQRELELKKHNPDLKPITQIPGLPDPATGEIKMFAFPVPPPPKRPRRYELTPLPLREWEIEKDEDIWPRPPY